MIGRFEILPLLIAARSFQRFGEFRETSNSSYQITLIEYLVIGILLSLTWGSLTGLLTAWLSGMHEIWK